MFLIYSVMRVVYVCGYQTIQSPAHGHFIPGFVVLLTIVCYDSILNKFTVLYCKGFVMGPKFFPERWARQTHPAHPG